jgi:hypothetical protein
VAHTKVQGKTHANKMLKKTLYKEGVKEDIKEYLKNVKVD